MKIVCIGDSITSGGYGITTPYPPRLNARLGGGWIVVNKGIGGDYTTNMLARFTPDVIDLTPNYVVIEGGINDFIFPAPTGTPPETTRANITAMCDAAVSAGITPIVCTIAWRLGFYSGITAHNEWVTTFAATNGYGVIDFHTTLEDPADLGNPYYPYMYDSIHPNDLGQQAIVNAIDLHIFNIYRENYTTLITSSCETEQTIQISVGWDK